MKKLILTLFLLSSYLAYGQFLWLYDVDDTNYPTMKAKLFAIDSNGQPMTGLSESNFIIKENYEEKIINNISCVTPKPLEPISSVLVIDAGSPLVSFVRMQEAAKVWVDALPPGSDCAITLFGERNYLIQDFTEDKDLLHFKIDDLFAMEKTDYDVALIKESAGGLIVSEKGTHKRVVVMMTDVSSELETDIEDIISKANNQNCSVYCVTIRMPMPESLKEIAIRTGGATFEYVYHEESITSSSQTILKLAQGVEPCTIEWESNAHCNLYNVDMELTLKNPLLISLNQYFPPKSSISKLTFSPPTLVFNDPIPGVTNEKKITLSAHNLDYIISDIISSNSEYTISPTSFELKKGESIELTITYNALDSGYNYCQFEFINNLCPTSLIVSGGWVGIKPNIPVLKLTFPNGGEKFVIGSDKLITWEGISPKVIVRLEYSIDNGQTWNLITDSASGLQYIWENIPKPESDNCLFKISKGNYTSDYDPSNPAPSLIWEKTYGGSKSDDAKKILETRDGSLIVAGVTDSRNGDINAGSKGDYLDFWIIKIDPDDGNIIWENIYGGSDFDKLNSIIELSDGTLIAVGRTSSNDGDVNSYNHGGSDFWVVKIDPNDGRILSEKRFGGSYFDEAYSIIETSDGNLVIGGVTNSINGDVQSNDTYSYRLWVIKIDTIDMNIIWEKTFGDLTVSFDGLPKIPIKESKDKNLLFAGTPGLIGEQNNNLQSRDYWLMKIDTDNGNLIWEKTYGGSGTDHAYSMIEASDGSIFIAGDSNSDDGDVKSGNKGSSDYWIIKIDQNNGELIWEKTYGGSASDCANSIIESSDGQLIVAGYAGYADGDIKSKKRLLYDYWIIKIDQNNGELIWEKALGGYNVEIPYSIIESSDGSLFAAGLARSDDGDIKSGYKGGNNDFWVVKLAHIDYNIQNDTSDAVFSIVAPKAISRDIDMKKALVGSIKDSVIAEFIQNTGDWDFTVDSIYFEGADANVFSLVSGFPKYTVEANNNYFAEIRFAPTEERIFNAVVVIITQSDTLKINIRGEGYSINPPFLTIRAEELSAYSGARNDFHIFVDSIQFFSENGINSINFDLEYNPTLIAFLDYDVNIISDSLGITSFKDIPISEIDGSTLLKIRSVAGLGNAEFCDLKITNVELNIDTADITTIDGRFDILGICDEGGTRLINPTDNNFIFTISPNPSDGNVEISINLLEEGTKSLKIYDYNGALIEEFNLSSNLGSINLNLNTQKYLNGLYFVHLQTPTIIKREKLIINR